MDVLDVNVSLLLDHGQGLGKLCLAARLRLGARLVVLKVVQALQLDGLHTSAVARARRSK